MFEQQQQQPAANAAAAATDQSNDNLQYAQQQQQQQQYYQQHEQAQAQQQQQQQQQHEEQQQQMMTFVMPTETQGSHIGGTEVAQQQAGKYAVLARQAARYSNCGEAVISSRNGCSIKNDSSKNAL
eukprot:6643-Heterococcus_DN1.PRE.1